MISYSRWAPPQSLEETVAHVRAHISSVADPDDDPHRYALQVEISRKPENGGVLITGTLEADAVADYLAPDFDPDADTRFDTSEFRREDFEEVDET